MTLAAHVRLLVEALGLRAAMPALLWTRSLDGVLRALTPDAHATPATSASLAAIEVVSDALTRGAPPLRTACLQRALLRYALLRRSGRPARFVIGVRPGGSDGFEAHAWVELDGAPIMEREATRFRATFGWPGDSPSA